MPSEHRSAARIAAWMAELFPDFKIRDSWAMNFSEESSALEEENSDVVLWDVTVIIETHVLDLKFSGESTYSKFRGKRPPEGWESSIDPANWKTLIRAPEIGGHFLPMTVQAAAELLQTLKDLSWNNHPAIKHRYSGGRRAYFEEALEGCRQAAKELLEFLERVEFDN